MIHYITSQGIGVPTIANELRVVVSAGIPFVLHAMRRPQLRYFDSDWAGDLDRNTRVLYPISTSGLVLSVVAAPFLFRHRFFEALANAVFGRRECLRARVASFAHFFVACHWARTLRHESVALIHAPWVLSAGTIGMYGAWLLGKPFSFTGHATDLFRDRVALKDKIRRAVFIICISSFHRDFYLAEGAEPDKLSSAHFGVDINRLRPELPGSKAGRFRIVSLGRLVEKKGFADLVEACRLLQDRGIDFECEIAGAGPCEASLREQIRKAGLEDRVRVPGRVVEQENLPAFFGRAHAFCLPCVWARDRDVDGLPQTLMEAMACGVPVISTRLVGIPDLVIHEGTGLLVEPHDTRALAGALERLKASPELCNRLSKAARLHVVERFNMWTSLEPMLRRFKDWCSTAQA